MLRVLFLACLLSPGIAMDYFTFEIDGVKVGYYEEEDRDGIISSNARMVIGGEIYENPFWVRYQGTTVTAYRFGGGEWLPFTEPAGVYPSSALPLVLRAMAGADRFEYRFFHEGKGAIVGPAVLTRAGDRITESVAGKPRRHVVLAAGRVIEYGWGGTAVSKRVDSKAAAVHGTVFADDGKQP